MKAVWDAVEVMHLHSITGSNTVIQIAISGLIKDHRQKVQIYRLFSYYITF